MDSTIEINDTLQITKEQGFPAELNYEKHIVKPLRVENFEGRIFEFRNKSGIRAYQSPPVRNFLVENRGGKWIYWGLIHVTETTQYHRQEPGNETLNNSRPRRVNLAATLKSPKMRFFDNAIF